MPPKGHDSKFYKTLLDLSSDLVMVVDASGHVTFVNEASERILGYHSAELMSRDLLEFVHPDDRQAVTDLLERSKALPGEPIPGACRIRHRDGEWRYVESHASSRPDERIIGGSIITSRDVTEFASIRDDYEKRLLASAEQFRNLIEHSSFGTILVSAEGIPTLVNDAFLKLLGYSREEFESGSIRWESLTPASSRQATDLALIEARSVGHSVPFEKQYIRKDASLVYALVSYAVLGSNGELAVFATDITELRRAHEELERFARILESTSDAVLSLSLTGKITTWNAAAEHLYGYSAEEIIGRPDTDLAPADRQDDFAKMLQVVVRGESLVHYETVRRRKDGSLFPVSLTVSPVRDAAGTIVGMSKIARDLSEAKQAELMAAQLRQAQKIEAVGRLAGGVAHDFNNMLMVIISYTELLQDTLPPTDPRRRNTQEVLKASKRAALIASQLLAFSRRQILRPEVLELKTLVREMLGMIRRLIGEDVELTLKLNDAPTKVKIDPGQATQILMNLCVNARDAMPNGGDIRIEVQEVYLDEQYRATHSPVAPGWYVMLSVTDTGSGIPPEIRDKIFEPFFTTKDVNKGTGLGLATVYGIVKQSGGSIWVYSEMNKGTTFKIYLPRVDAEVEGGKVQIEEQQVRVTDEVVLLVEDEHALRESIAEYLKSIGYEVLTASQGEEALKVAASFSGQIKFIVTDVIMPNMSGKEAVERLKAVRPDIKAVFMSGYSEEAISHHGILDEGVEFLQKPFAFAMLARTLRRMM